ncbi:MAG TPA: hypothetical protein PLJ27_00620 [Polyangiaceae bacterium]|jgi:hypothetical protein|nr:MAG: hypothetical protein BWY17_04046 [Deltaproteobacteria bacterium ADurb.Bin207]HNS95900.1 hypothetical protein [Polyangiaceae bacterium]HNZ24538.1 hypothetical protein [Polyangiaceae bacterium]HOD21976.1 hypothetical protein [Polyangiaceae bacterium]HOE47942.1 hypothetical protein [Polyangiaceae bacterium]
MNQRNALAIAAVLAIVTVPLACRKEPESPQPFVPTTTAPTDTQPQTTAPTTTQTAPTASATSTQPSPTIFDPAVQQLLAAQLVPIAQTDAKGMKKEGEIISGVLQEGQSLEQIAMLQPGKCYTVVGLGMPMVQELDIVMAPLIPLPGAPNLPMAQDLKTGAQATMAPAPDCYKHVLPLPIQVKIIVTAKTGSGPVGAQLYVK